MKIASWLMELEVVETDVVAVETYLHLYYFENVFTLVLHFKRSNM